MRKAKTPDELLPLAVKITADKRQMWMDSDPERVARFFGDRSDLCASVGLLIGPNGGRKRLRCSKLPEHLGPHIHYESHDPNKGSYYYRGGTIVRRPLARWDRDLSSPTD